METPGANVATPPPFATRTRRSLRVLIVDDLRELREVSRISLLREGHHVECAEDGSQAWERIAGDPGAFDVVITDHHMPVMNGLALVTHLRTIPYHGKIVIFSSELALAVAHAYHELHVDRILFKPVFPSVLRQVLSELFA